MNKKRNEKWLDELISRSINTEKPQFDAEKWKQKYPEEFQMLLSRAAQKSLTPSARQPNIWRVILKSPITKLAAAVVAMITICVALYFTITLNQPSNVTTNTRESKTGSSKPTAMMRPILLQPRPNEVRLDRNLDGEKMNRRIPQDGWIQIGKPGLLWYYTGGTYLDFKVEEPLIYLSVDEGPYELAGVRLQTPDDLESLNAVLQEYSPRSLTIWCHIQPPYELAELPYLEKIISFQQVDPNVLSDLAPLAYLTNLEAVHIKNRHQPCLQVVDVSPLSNLNELKLLTLYGFHNLSSISDMGMNLTYLDLTGAINLKDLTPLAKLTKLKYLRLHSCYRVTDISPLADLANLTSLELFGCQFTDLSPIENLTSLTFLGLCGSVVSDFSPIENLTNLEELNLGACSNLSDLSPLANLENLKNLNLWACHRLTDLWPLAGLASLESLNLRACDNITDLSPLSDIVNLKKLDLLGCKQVSDLSPLANLTNLRTINLTVCPEVSDLSPLKGIVAEGTNIYVDDRLKEQLSEIRSQILAERIAEASTIISGKLVDITDTLLGEELISTELKVKVIKVLYGQVPGEVINVVLPEPDAEWSTASLEPDKSVILFLVDWPEQEPYRLIYGRKGFLPQYEKDITDAIESSAHPSPDSLD